MGIQHTEQTCTIRKIPTSLDLAPTSEPKGSEPIAKDTMDKATATRVNEVKETLARFTERREKTMSLIAQQPGLAQFFEQDLAGYESVISRCKSFIRAVSN